MITPIELKKIYYHGKCIFLKGLPLLNFGDQSIPVVVKISNDDESANIEVEDIIFCGARRNLNTPYNQPIEHITNSLSLQTIYDDIRIYGSETKSGEYTHNFGAIVQIKVTKDGVSKEMKSYNHDGCYLSYLFDLETWTFKYNYYYIHIIYKNERYSIYANFVNEIPQEGETVEPNPNPNPSDITYKVYNTITLDKTSDLALALSDYNLPKFKFYYNVLGENTCKVVGWIKTSDMNFENVFYTNSSQYSSLSINKIELETSRDGVKILTNISNFVNHYFNILDYDNANINEVVTPNYVLDTTNKEGLIDYLNEEYIFNKYKDYVRIDFDVENHTPYKLSLKGYFDLMYGTSPEHMYIGNCSYEVVRFTNKTDSIYIKKSVFYQDYNDSITINSSKSYVQWSFNDSETYNTADTSGRWMNKGDGLHVLKFNFVVYATYSAEEIDYVYNVTNKFYGFET